MKKVCMYISVLITVCFMLPAIFTNTNKQTSSHVNDVSQSLQSNEENSNFDGEIKQSSDSKEIKLLYVTIWPEVSCTVKQIFCQYSSLLDSSHFFILIVEELQRCL